MLLHVVSLSSPSYVSPAGRVGEGEKPNHTVRRRERLVLYNPFTTLYKTGVILADDVYPYQGPD